ncbi:archease family protein, putative [Babesia ovata]|uniref:Archease family protein, putative n=1 Tax=Babesia ovata TaxID=189622 RepID=A0A2H6K8E5_9APIC|nr:archease family protein, putative [Babesia ovata]GBE59264.1 archease family protein, putative [Babesia ovata]
MEASNTYVIDGVEITSKPPRARRKGNVPRGRHDEVEEPPSPPESSEVDIASEVQELASESHEFGYLDHPADVIITGSGKHFCRALESIILAMFGYITDTSLVDARSRRSISAAGKSLNQLLFHVLVECLYMHNGHGFVARYVRVEGEVDVQRLLQGDEPAEVTVSLYGDIYDRALHTCGTEIKAITYHGLKTQITVGDQAVTLTDDPAEGTSPDALSHFLRCMGVDSLKTAEFKLFAHVDI